MLRVTVELLPFGSETDKKTIGVIKIANVGRNRGDGFYRSRFFDEEGQEVGAVDVSGHRSGDGFWPLLLRSLLKFDRVGSKKSLSQGS